MGFLPPRNGIIGAVAVTLVWLFGSALATGAIPVALSHGETRTQDLRVGGG
jgi:hypothetical protein